MMALHIDAHRFARRGSELVDSLGGEAVILKRPSRQLQCACVEVVVAEGPDSAELPVV